jgi:hypothetical protein
MLLNTYITCRLVVGAHTLWTLVLWDALYSCWWLSGRTEEEDLHGSGFSHEYIREGAFSREDGRGETYPAPRSSEPVGICWTGARTNWCPYSTCSFSAARNRALRMSSQASRPRVVGRPSLLTHSASGSEGQRRVLFSCSASSSYYYFWGSIDRHPVPLFIHSSICVCVCVWVCVRT